MIILATKYLLQYSTFVHLPHFYFRHWFNLDRCQITIFQSRALIFLMAVAAAAATIEEKKKEEKASEKDDGELRADHESKRGRGRRRRRSHKRLSSHACTSICSGLVFLLLSIQ